jgi:limonene-1,2-epoxide hydrolase
MPWFPEFANAAELARGLTRAAGRADPVAQYLRALERGDTHALEEVWPAQVVIWDPRAGEVRGHRELRRFVRRNQEWLAQHEARIETLATTRASARAVVELLAHLSSDPWQQSWPVAVVADSGRDDEMVFRTYCSQQPVDGRRHLRPPVLGPADRAPGDVVGRHLAALAAGDLDAVVATFAPNGYVREPVGGPDTHRGPEQLRSFFATRFGAEGGLLLEPCRVTDDGERCVVEFTCTRWAGRTVPAQAGLGVYERGPDGLLAAARYYDDVQAPVEHPATSVRQPAQSGPG